MALRGRLAAVSGAWLVFEDETGFSMTPPQAKTWLQLGRTPVVRVRGRSRRRVSIAALTCHKPGHRSRLIYRPRRDDGQRDGRRNAGGTVHQGLGAAWHLRHLALNAHAGHALQVDGWHPRANPAL